MLFDDLFMEDCFSSKSRQAQQALLELPQLVANISAPHTLEQFLSVWVKALLRGFEPPSNAEEISDRQAAYKLFLPLRMADDFPNCSVGQVHQLAVCDAYGLVYSGWVDEIIDNLPHTQEMCALDEQEALAGLAFERMIFSLQKLFPPDSEFWGYLHGLIEQFSSAMQWETSRRCQKVAECSYDEFCSLAQGKMALALINPIALSILNKTPEHLPGLIKAWREISVAVILLDDIQDWKGDFEEKQFSFLINQVLVARKFEGTVNINQLAEWIPCSGVIPTLLACTAAHLQQACKIASENHALAHARLCQDCLHYLERYMQKNDLSFPETTPINFSSSRNI